MPRLTPAQVRAELAKTREQLARTKGGADALDRAANLRRQQQRKQAKR